MPIGAPAQKLISISRIQEGVVILDDNSYRAVLLVTSINFALKSQEEQEAIITRFQAFLNSLDFPLQIIVHSRRLNIEPYLKEISERERQEENELLRVQAREYQDFIRELVGSVNVMSKAFYVVVPYALIEAQKKRGVKELLGGLFKKTPPPQVKKQQFYQAKAQLWQRVDHIALSLAAMGMRAIPLNTEELIELFYGLYNPGQKEKPRLGSLEEMGISE